MRAKARKGEDSAANARDASDNGVGAITPRCDASTPLLSGTGLTVKRSAGSAQCRALVIAAYGISTAAHARQVLVRYQPADTRRIKVRHSHKAAPVWEDAVLVGGVRDPSNCRANPAGIAADSITSDGAETQRERGSDRNSDSQPLFEGG